MNKKEKRLIEIFEEAREATREECEGSVWFFLGYLKASLIKEAHGKNKDESWAEQWDACDELFKKLNEITKGLR